MKNKDLIKIFIAIFTEITAFGMLIPLTPIVASRMFGEDSLKIGLLISAYSMVQFVLAPFWGRLSDRFGRKPILLLGFMGSACAHLLFAFSDSFMDIVISRLLAGFFGGNVVIASAYIADKTSVKNRSKNLGLIGMAFGAGFTIGPLLGFLFILLGESISQTQPFGIYFASMGASILCLLNGILSFFLLKESLPYKKDLKSIFQKNSFFKRPDLLSLWNSFKTPELGVVLMMSFILWFSLAHIEPVLTLLVLDDFLWDKKTAYASFIYIGILMIFSQAYLVRHWIPKWGESLVNRLGLMGMSAGLLMIAGSSLLASFSISKVVALLFLVFGVTAFSIGYSLSNTSLNGALSLLSPDSQQGRIFGVNQSLSSMARIIGPALGGWLYQHLSHPSPFLFAGLLSLTAFLIAILSQTGFPNKGKLSKTRN